MNYQECNQECARMKEENPDLCYAPRHQVLIFQQFHEQPDGKLMMLPGGIMAISPEIYREVAEEVPEKYMNKGWYVYHFSVDDY